MVRIINKRKKNNNNYYVKKEESIRTFLSYREYDLGPAVKYNLIFGLIGTYDANDRFEDLRTYQYNRVGRRMCKGPTIESLYKDLESNDYWARECASLASVEILSRNDDVVDSFDKKEVQRKAVDHWTSFLYSNVEPFTFNFEVLNDERSSVTLALIQRRPINK